jgi:hypothetical protein
MVEGEVLARFRVGADGRVDPSSVAIVRSTHVLFTQAVRGALRRARYLPGDAGRPGDAELVEQTFRFQRRADGPPRPTAPYAPPATGHRRSAACTRSAARRTTAAPRPR